MRARAKLGLTGAALLAVSVFAIPAAQSASPGLPDYTYPQITVQSEIYPSRTISGAVRRGPRGDQVQLPGGTWVPCGVNCAFTLRNATIDFWRRYDVFPH